MKRKQARTEYKLKNRKISIDFIILICYNYLRNVKAMVQFTCGMHTEPD